MAVIPVGFAQVNMIWGGNAYGRGAQTVFGVDNTTATLSPTDIANVVIAAWDANVDAVQGQDIDLSYVKVKLGPNDTGAEGQSSSGQGGNIASNCLPPNTSVLVTKHTPLGGRTKGRLFFPGATEGQTDGGGFLTASALADWDAAMGQFLISLAGEDVPMVVLSTNPAATPLIVTSLEVQQRMATQKRRLRRAGGHRPTP